MNTRRKKRTARQRDRGMLREAEAKIRYRGDKPRTLLGTRRMRSGGAN